MMFRYPTALAVYIAAAVFAAGGTITFANTAETEQQVKSLQERNAKLEELVRQQATMIEGLNDRVAALEKNKGTAVETETAPPPKSSSGFNFGKVNISGEG